MPARETRRRTSGEEAVVKTCCEKSHFFVCLGYLRALESKNVQIHNCVVVFMLGLKNKTKTLLAKNEQLGLDILCR